MIGQRVQTNNRDQEFKKTSKVMVQRQTRQNSEACRESRRVTNRGKRSAEEEKESFLKQEIENTEVLNKQNEAKKFYNATKGITEGF